MTRVPCLLTGKKYNPGDMPPKGYLAWHEWADTQHKAGLRQTECGLCGKWKFPQELSKTIIKHMPFIIKHGLKETIEISYHVCRECMGERTPK